MIWSLALTSGGTVLLSGDNMSVVLKTKIPSKVLKKKYNTRQKTLEGTTIYRSEVITSRLATEFVVEVIYMLRPLVWQ